MAYRRIVETARELPCLISGGPAHSVALAMLALVLGGCASSSSEDCGRPGGVPCSTTTASITVTSTTTTSSTTTVSSTSSTSMPSRAHACCLPDLTCDHMGEQQCYRRGGSWEPGDSIFCYPRICENPGGYHGNSEITISVTNTETLGALQFDVDYGAVPGGFNGTAGGVDCTRLAADFIAFNDHEAEAALSVALISLDGITGPIDIASCTFCCPPLPDPNEFVVTITDQSRPDLSPASATVAVTRVRALDVLSTTSTTTTTLSN